MLVLFRRVSLLLRCRVHRTVSLSMYLSGLAKTTSGIAFLVVAFWHSFRSAFAFASSCVEQYVLVLLWIYDQITMLRATQYTMPRSKPNAPNNNNSNKNNNNHYKSVATAVVVVSVFDKIWRSIFHAMHGNRMSFVFEASEHIGRQVHHAVRIV